MNKTPYTAILASSKIRKRISHRVWLSFLTAFLFFCLVMSYYLAIAYIPDFMARSLSRESFLPAGVIIGIGFILLSVIFSFVYPFCINLYNKRLDKHLRDLESKPEAEQ